MPEIAESHIMADDLSVIEDQTIISYEYYDEKYSSLDIEGRKVKTICAIGKRIVFILDKGYLISTLSMTGKWIIPSEWVGNEYLLDDILSYTKIKLIFSNNIVIVFSDVRTWGDLEYYDEIDDELNKLGPDVLNGELDIQDFVSMLDKKWRKIGDLLNDQAIIAGIGNYLRAEILYDAKVNPTRKANDLSIEEKERLYHSIHKICRIAYESGGLSISNNAGNYISPRGVGGTYDAKVYNKKQCPKGHTVSKIRGNQTVHYCNKCQV